MATEDGTIIANLTEFDDYMKDFIWEGANSQWDMMMDVSLALGGIFALVIVARMAYKMMVLEEGIDFLALLRPMLVAFVLANWYWVTLCLVNLTAPVESYFKGMYIEEAKELQKLRDRREAAVYAIQNNVREETAKAKTMSLIEESVVKEETGKDIETNKEMDVDMTLSENFGDIYYPDDMDVIVSPYHIQDMQTSNFLEPILLWIGETIWEVSCWFIFLIKNVFTGVLVIFGPIMIVCCLLPVWHDVWSQWLGRMISVSLYGACSYMVMLLAMQLIHYGLLVDVEVLEKVVNSEEAKHAMMKFSSNMLGTLSLYLIALLVGSAAMSSVPVIATWAIPSEAIRSTNEFVGGAFSSVKRTAILAAKAVVVLATAGAGGAAGGAAAGSGASSGAAAGAGSGSTASTASSGAASSGAGNTTTQGSSVSESPTGDISEAVNNDSHSPAEEYEEWDNEKTENNREEEDSLSFTEEIEQKEVKRRKLIEDLDEYEKAIEGGYEQSYMIEKGYDTQSYDKLQEELDKLEKELNMKNKKKRR